MIGSRQAPYIRLDPYFTTPLDDDASAALKALAQTIDDNLQEVILQPGDCFFIDNYRIVHGRKAFKARYDGTDRWLKRVSITTDLFKVGRPWWAEPPILRRRREPETCGNASYTKRCSGPEDRIGAVWLITLAL